MRQPQRLAVKIERDRWARQMINTRSYSLTYDLRSSCLLRILNMERKL